MSIDYWEQRYESGDMPWEKGAASPGLVDFLAAHQDLARSYDALGRKQEALAEKSIVEKLRKESAGAPESPISPVRRA